MSTQFLKGLLKACVSKFGAEQVNEALAQICYEEYKETKNVLLDELSEAYDDINWKLFKTRRLKDLTSENEELKER